MTIRFREHTVRMLALALLILAAVAAGADNRGIPFVRSYGAADYNAHNRNYDIACDAYGTVFVANFEGLLYYDGSAWRKIHTPGISRVTRIARGNDGRIWVGGFNVLGYLEPDAKGRLQLRTIVSDNGGRLFGEVDMIKVEGDDVFVHTSSGSSYLLKKGRALRKLSGRMAVKMVQTTDSIMNISMQGQAVSALRGQGIELRQDGVSRLITESDGLCSTAINFITYDKRRTVWGATDNGVFAIELPSPFSCVSEAQGLKGEVYSIGMIGDTVFFGTLQGIYCLRDGIVTQMQGMNLACWQIMPLSEGVLLAATADGLYRITAGGLRRMTDGNTLSVCKGRGNLLYTGEMDGVYEVSESGGYRLIAPIEKCVKVQMTGGTLHVETLYGECWKVSFDGRDKVEKVNNHAAENVAKIDYMDTAGRRWFTDSEGKNLRVSVRGRIDRKLTEWVRPMADRTLNAIHVKEGQTLWVGGDFGAINLSLSAINDGRTVREKASLYIRQVVAFNDSVMWGGYSPKGIVPVTDVRDIRLPSSCHRVTVYFSAGTMSIFHPTQYRYRLNGGRWSAWSKDAYVRFNNLSYGPSRLEVQALDLFGRVSGMASVEWYLEFPFYWKWWAVVFYVLVLGLLVRSVSLYRMKRLERDKLRLEHTVRERTEELSTALDDLQRTQVDLMRMERTATAGKLTQGLIDRILNPINYINNFSKLTSGLAKDLHEDIKDEKENMSEENFDDCEDIISMMQTNLAKIEEHGVNTTRTLRAMEAMLKNQIGTLRSTDMTLLCRQVMRVTAEYHKKDIEACGIVLHPELPETPVMCDVDADAINRALIAVLTNAVYAVVKKWQRQPYSPEVTLRLTTLGGSHIEILVHDNGIGIEDAIVGKVFDPFFTTKPTGEAAGVGLYLAREIVQDHNGTIAVRSEKDVFTEVIISI